jgi:hypothetical protein
VTCQALVKRTPHAVVQTAPLGSDFTHLQLCGRPVERDGLCAVHLRRRKL